MASRARIVRTVYRNVLRQARRADADVILRHQISKQPVDVLQVASAGLGRSCRSVNVQINGQRGRIPRLHAIYDRDPNTSDFAAPATVTPATPAKVWMSTKCPDTGRTYYYDLLTRETTWQKPEGEIRESTGDDSAARKDALLPKIASVAVVAQHADYGDNVFYDGAATAAGPDGVFVNFDDGDTYGWTGDEVRSSAQINLAAPSSHRPPRRRRDLTGCLHTGGIKSSTQGPRARGDARAGDQIIGCGRALRQGTHAVS